MKNTNLEFSTARDITANRWNETAGSSNWHAALKAGVLLLGGAAAATIAANAVIAAKTSPLGGRLSGGFNRYAARHGDMAYYVSGSGAPLLLLHDLRPGNSNAEWENNFDALAENYTVFAPDFLGWGLSDKPRHILRAEDYAEQITHFVEDVIENAIGARENTPVVVIASGHAATFALLASQKSPELFARLILVCPSSQEEYSDQSAHDPADEAKDARLHPVFKLLTTPIAGQALLNVMTSRRRLESEAQSQLFFDKTRIHNAFIARLHTAAHQPGTATSLAAQIAGVLGGPWQKAWENFTSPALLVWGRNAVPEGIETAPEWLALKPNADLEVFGQALFAPHIEHAEEFNARVLGWLKNSNS